MTYATQRSQDNHERIASVARAHQRAREAEMADIDRVPFAEAVRRGLDEDVKQAAAERAFRISQIAARARTVLAEPDPEFVAKSADHMRRMVALRSRVRPSQRKRLDRVVARTRVENERRGQQL